MATGKRPGPHGSYGDPPRIEDGTLCRASSAAPGALGLTPFDVPGIAESETRERAACLAWASSCAAAQLSKTLLQETGYAVDDLPKSLLLHLRKILLLIGSTPPDGAAKLPLRQPAHRVVSGTDLGFDLTRPIVSELGVAMLAESMREGLAEVVDVLHQGIQRAWQAAEPSSFNRAHQTDSAADELARAMGVLARVFFQSIVSYVQEKSGTRSGRLATAAKAPGKEATLAGKFRFLERDRDLATWLEQHWTELLEKPELRRRGHVELLVENQEDAAERPPRQPNRDDESSRDEKTWVAVKLVDESGQPVPNERYRILLPDGSVKDGTLNELGEVEFDEIDPGQCQISFPNIDGREWRAA